MDILTCIICQYLLNVKKLFFKIFRLTFWTFKKSSLTQQTIKFRCQILLLSRPWKFGLETCITLPYLNSNGKIMGGLENTPPLTKYILDKYSPIGIGSKCTAGIDIMLTKKLKKISYHELKKLEFNSTNEKATKVWKIKKIKNKNVLNFVYKELWNHHI